MAEIAFRPPRAEAGGVDDRGAPFERFRARGAKRDVAHAGHFRRGELERVVFVIVPGAQVHRIAAAAALRHAQDVDEKPEAVVRPRRQQLDVREVGEVC